MFRFQFALRLFGTRSGSRLMSFVGLLSIGGLALAVAVLVTVLSVVNGFDRELRERVLGVLPHATLYSRTNLSDWQTVRAEAVLHPDVTGAAPIVEGAGLVLTSGDLKGIGFSGVSPEFEPSVSVLPQHMLEGSLDELVSGAFGVLIGSELANLLDVRKGERLTLVLPDVGFSIAGPTVTTRRLIVAGVFETGADIDRTQLFLHLDDAMRLKRQKFVDGVVIRIEDLFDVHKVVHELTLSTTDPSLFGVSWMRRNGNLYEAIQTQKATLFLLLMILVAVAAFNVVSNLVMTVDDNRSQIAIMRSMGASPSDLRLIFVIHGVLVGLIGLFIGVALGLLLTASIGTLVGSMSEWLGIELMREYFVRYLPTEVRLMDIAAIAAMTLGISVFATLYPASRAANANPAEALQYDV